MGSEGPSELPPCPSSHGPRLGTLCLSPPRRPHWLGLGPICGYHRCPKAVSESSSLMLQRKERRSQPPPRSLETRGERAVMDGGQHTEVTPPLAVFSPTLPQGPLPHEIISHHQFQKDAHSGTGLPSFETCEPKGLHPLLAPRYSKDKLQVELSRIRASEAPRSFCTNPGDGFYLLPNWTNAHGPLKP